MEFGEILPFLIIGLVIGVIAVIVIGSKELVTDGRSPLKKIIIGNVQISDVIFFILGVTVAGILVWIGYTIMFGMKIGFNEVLPTYEDIFASSGVTSLFDKITYFNYTQWTFLSILIMTGTPIVYIVGMIGQWIVIWIIMGLFLAISGLGHRYRVVLNAIVVFLILQLMIIWINPSLAGSGDVRSMASVMVMINFIMVFLFAILFDKILSKTLFKYTREWELSE